MKPPLPDPLLTTPSTLCRIGTSTQSGHWRHARGTEGPDHRSVASGGLPAPPWRSAAARQTVGSTHWAAVRLRRQQQQRGGRRRRRQRPGERRRPPQAVVLPGGQGADPVGLPDPGRGGPADHTAARAAGRRTAAAAGASAACRRQQRQRQRAGGWQQPSAFLQEHCKCREPWHRCTRSRGSSSSGTSSSACCRRHGRYSACCSGTGRSSGSLTAHAPGLGRLASAQQPRCRHAAQLGRQRGSAC